MKKKAKKVPIKFNKNILRTYFVAGTQDFGENGAEKLEAALKQALESGITAYQYREKGSGSLKGSEKVNLGKKLHQLCMQYKVPFIIDDDVDLALETAADGIHVGQKDEGIQSVVNDVKDKMFVGYSCNTGEEIKEANETTGISYLGIGTVYPTNSKADAGKALGLKKLTDLVSLSKYPVVAIGGITEQNIVGIPATGAVGVAAISMITQSDNINRTIKVMNQTFGSKEK